MHATRISIARILESDVPLTWQEAVAVVQEVAMVSDVNAAMNSSPSLVTPEACFLTTAGEVDLPETTADEAPDAVADLLRTVLSGRDAPAALEALARRRTDDLFGDLTAFSSGPRRPVIAALAARALSPRPVAAASSPEPPPLPPPPPERIVSPSPAAAAEPVPLATPLAPPFSSNAPAQAPWPAPRLVHGAAEQVRPAATPVPPPFVASPRAATAVSLAPPFRAVEPASGSETTALDPAPDLELQRLRARTLGGEPRVQRWSARVAAWLSWRPSFPDPRLLGGAVVVLAAAFVVWRGTPPGSAVPVASPPSPAAALPSTPVSVAPAPAPAAATPAAPTAPLDAVTVPSPRSAARNPASRPAAPASAPSTAAAASVSPGSSPVFPAAEPRRGLEAGTNPSPRATAAPDTSAAPPAGAPRDTSIVIPALDPPRPAARPGREVARSRVPFYTATDTNVIPPVMLRQQLPSPLLEPGADVPPGGPYLELLIDENGAVEQVRLRARQPQPGQTWYRHRMLLAAAKAWQFEPARLDQLAVRYLMRVPLEP